MAQITVLTSRELEDLVARYPVGKLLQSEPLAGGLANSSVKITTETGTYVLSVCDEKQLHEIQHLCAVLRCLEEHDFATTRVIDTNRGESCVSWQDKPVYLKRFIDGRVMERLDDRQLAQVGAGLARLHEIPAHPDLLHHFSYGIECFGELSHRPSAAAFHRWLSGHRERIAEACSDSLPRGFVHGDLFVDNMLFVDGSLAAFLDFEEACNYYRVFDIGMSAVGCCCPAGTFSLSGTAALVDGYQRVRKLEPEERRLLQAHTIYGAAATAFWRYRQYHFRNPDPALERHFEGMVKLADQVAAIEPECFIRSVFDLHQR
jgi:homoserine kinase type II